MVLLNEWQTETGKLFKINFCVFDQNARGSAQKFIKINFRACCEIIFATSDVDYQEVAALIQDRRVFQLKGSSRAVVGYR